MPFLLSTNLRRLSRLYSKRVMNKLPTLHSESLAEIMLALASGPMYITQKQLAEQLAIDKSRLATMLDELNRLQYIFVQKNMEDRREHFVFLTARGEKLIPIIKGIITSVNDRINYQLDQAHIEFFHFMIQQMEDNLHEET